MTAEMALRGNLDSLRERISRHIEVCDCKVGELNMAWKGLLEGVLAVQLRHVKAMLVMAAMPAGSVTIEVWPDFSRQNRKRWEADEMDLLVHLEAVAAAWKAESLGSAERVYQVPKPLIAELWVVCKAQLDALVPQCEELPSVYKVIRSDLHVYIGCCGATWMFSRNDTMTDYAICYAARMDVGMLRAMRSRLCRQGIRDRLIGTGATRIR